MNLKLEKYLQEAINTNEVLKITTVNDKTYKIKVISFGYYKVNYYFDNGQLGSIYKNKIVQIEFFNKNKEKEFKRNMSPNKAIISQFSEYYLKCIDELDENIIGKRKLYEQIFDKLYTVDNDNLLLKYIKGVKTDNDDYTDIEYPILVDKSNESQKQAIRNALNNKISIIEGPPGTGKTTTILSIIANLIREDKKVVVVSKNNSAVNNIIEEFSKTDLPQFYVRFGRKEIMDALKENETELFLSLQNSLNNLTINNDDIAKLVALESELKELEPKINDMMNINRLLEELKVQKKFIDKKVRIYGFINDLNDDEKKIITKKNANVKTIVRLIKYARKEKLNFIEKILIKYKYCIDINNIDLKLQAIISLLTKVYIDNEIARNEKITLDNNLKIMQNRVDKIYKEYIHLSVNYFKYCLKQKIEITTNNNLIANCIQTFPLILTTADGFLFNFKKLINYQNQIDCVIIDEASQCDVLTGIPLLYLAKKLIVVGDSKQLSAITTKRINYPIDDKYRYENNNFLSTIKEVFDPPSKILLEHYRCDFNIINFCNKYYYNNELIIYKKSHNRAMSIVNADKFKGVEYCDGFINKREIKTIQEMSNDCTNTFYITPFKAQGELLIEKYNEHVAGTIHTFQGKGANNVYFSTVLNDDKACIYHLTKGHNLFTKELVNVAVSRAKKKFILVIDRKFFSDNARYVSDITNLINYIDIYGSKVSDNSCCCFDYLYKLGRYKKINKYFDNQYEEALYSYIQLIIEKNDNYMCVPKLYLTDLVCNESFLNQNPFIKQYIKNKAHADFTIIDNRCHKPVLVIELDGKYHNTKEQQIRDNYKKLALEASNIKILRISSKEAFDLFELKDLILNVISLDLD